jgi:putative oxidoreductase
MDSSPRNIIWRVIDLVIGGVFIVAGVIKIIHPLHFAYDIANYDAVPWTIGVRLAFYLPWLEVIAGVLLILRRFYAGALTVVFGLTVVFIGAIISARMRGIDISCGCFGHASDNLGFAWHLVMNFSILIAVFLLMRQVNPPARAVA